MGLFDGLRERKAQRAHEAAQQAYEAAFAEWQDEQAKLRQCREEVEVSWPNELPGVQLKKGEFVLLNYGGAALVEPRRGRGTYQGGYSGFSFQLVKGVRYHTGGSRGTYVPGEEKVTAIDNGTINITNQRVMFRGQKQAREWAFAKLMGYEHDASAPMTVLQVSNRQKVSGFVYELQHSILVRFRLALALAHFNQDLEDFREQVAAEVQEHNVTRPTAPRRSLPATTA